jgi:outer membrane protein assembly factor BamD (BamD/ComL family)
MRSYQERSEVLVRQAQKREWNVRAAKAAVRAAAKMVARHDPGTKVYDDALKRLESAKTRLAEQEKFYDNPEKEQA